MPKIKIACKGAMTASIDQLNPFQGNLKILTDESYRKLKKVIETYGFSEPISIWKHGKQLNILNGHQRLETLKRMRAEGWEVPDVPINIVEADSVKEAKKKILSLTSQYGEMTGDSLESFMRENEIDFNEIEDSFRFLEIELGQFDSANLDINFDEPPKEEKKKKEPEKELEIKTMQEFVIAVICEDEDQQKSVYEDLIGKGINCKII